MRVGWFDLKVHGKPVRLEAQRLLEPGVDESSISLFFRDATTGRETYGVGRYFVDPQKLPRRPLAHRLQRRLQPGVRVQPVLQLPDPSRANTLTIPIRAGEKDPHGEH